MGGEGRRGLGGTRPSNRRPTCHRDRRTDRPTGALGPRGTDSPATRGQHRAAEAVPRRAARVARGRAGCPREPVCGAEAAPAGRSLRGRDTRTQLGLAGVGCRGETKDGAWSLPFPPGAILGDFSSSSP